jgi:large subunit ribosomal protein L10e
MAKNPARMYRKIMQHAYTRREYMGGVPGNRIIQFESGQPNGDFPITLTLIAEERGQIRHTALESMRITAVRTLDSAIGRDNYHLQVRVYPHHVLRQNKQASGAGADRVSMGMRLAFGKAIGTAARVEPGQAILQVRVAAKGVVAAKDAFRKAYNKVATPCHIDIEGVDLAASAPAVAATA